MIDVDPARDVECDPERDFDRLALGGYQLRFVDEVLRGRVRRSFAAPTSLCTGARQGVEEVRSDLRSRDHVCHEGHRISMQLQGSWFPVIDCSREPAGVRRHRCRQDR